MSKYVDNPLLIGGRKFDLRLYVLVTNYRPLKVWKCSIGMARFCNGRYNNADMENMYIHLTNVSLQKNAENYNQSNGGKWTLENVYFYIESNYGKKRLKKLKEDIDYLILNSLKSVQVNFYIFYYLEYYI